MGRLLLRATLGAVFVVHGTQKLFGWFGGYGPDGTGQFFESLGLRPGRRNALLAGATETGSGVLLAAGAATPAAAAGVTGMMISALATTVWKDGIRPATGEFEVLLAAAALALADEGPGPWSVDAALGQERTGAPWALGALAAGAVGTGLVLASARAAQPTAPAPATESAPATASDA
ncbi:DoxX family protein [Blastococcus sp. TF02-09]|uniref:DoxX family protein n=1 Tax=Blastococcus sp. TF02-09 TaxID=2250576 RepID=UPI000DEB85D2|nr:DoxX family protein [Blastococcus sp. TF02-9]RBY77388.1 DoxX family protein [Blastococcus sp. TF02-9]